MQGGVRVRRAVGCRSPGSDRGTNASRLPERPAPARVVRGTPPRTAGPRIAKPPQGRVPEFGCPSLGRPLLRLVRAAVRTPPPGSHPRRRLPSPPLEALRARPAGLDRVPGGALRHLAGAGRRRRRRPRARLSRRPGATPRTSRAPRGRSAPAARAATPISLPDARPVRASCVPDDRAFLATGAPRPRPPMPPAPHPPRRPWVGVPQWPTTPPGPSPRGCEGHPYFKSLAIVAATHQRRSTA